MMATSERLLVRELKCFMCGFTLGEVIANRLQRVFRPAPGCPPLNDTRLSRLRCPRCSGPVYLEGAETTPPWSTASSRLASSSRRN